MAPPGALPRLIISFVSGLVVATALGHASWTVRFVAGWNALGVTYLALAWWLVLSSGADETRRRAEADEPGRGPALAIVLAGSVASLVVALRLLRRAGSPDLEPSTGLVILCFLAVVVSWLLIHTAFGAHYARLSYREGGLQFPGDDPLTYWDFAYFSFTVGMCFQVSDVVARTARMRRVVLAHAFIAYIYGTTVLALVINVVAGIWA